MMQNKIGSPDARKIVADLLYRYLLAKRRSDANPDRDDLYAHRNEAWNAYVGSKKILLGMDP